ncbi:MAG TPA: glycosyltransferase family 4 protein [Candidatus Thermoplasmatota archaeon]|nr:glycosyltransferase family 4 protein [Candidatus Thermoplasmatota archaeon]
MKVGMIGWEFPPFMAGGLGIHCLELTTQLAKMGVDIDFYMPHMSLEGDLRVADHHKHVKIHEVEADPGLSPYGDGRQRGYEESFNDAVWQYNMRVVDAWRSHDADVIHAHDWITYKAAAELKRRTGKPLIWSCHSTEYDRSAGFFPQEWIIDIEKAAVRDADLVIAVSGLTRQQLIDRYGADPEKVVAIHNGVDFSKWAEHSGRDYSRSNKVVLYLSRVSRQKGPMSFIRAAKRVLDRDRGVRFVVAGKGEMVPEMIQYCIQNGIMENVTFTGFVPDAEAQKLYEMADVYVLPSVSEPFGISVLEAMTSGCPTIVSKTTGVGEALTHVLRAEHWDSDEMADQILAVLRDKSLREALGRNGALEVRKFTWERCGRKTLDAYQRAVHRARGPMAVAA